MNQMGNAVDMTSLMKYVLNFTGQLPLYCYAEENLVVDCCSKATSTEQTHEVPLVSPGQTLLQHCNAEPQPTVRPPPGFLPRDASNIYSLGNTSSFVKAETTTNPFLDDADDTISTESVKEVFGQTWRENTQLQVQLSRCFFNLLERSSISRDTFESYIKQQHQVNSILKNMEKEFVSAVDDAFVNAHPMASTLNLVNEMPSRDTAPMPKTSFHPKDEFAAAASPNLPNVFGGNGSTNQTAPSFNTVHYDLNNFTFKNWRQPVDQFSPRLPSQIPVNPMPSYGAATGSTFQTTDHKTTKDAPPVKPMRPSNVSYSNSSSSSGFLSFKSDVCNNVPKETNPFRLSMIGEIQIPDTPSEQQRVNNNNYNPSSTYLPTINLKNYTNVDPANVYPKTETFVYACDVNNDNYVPRIVFEADPVMYNVQKKEANDNVTQSAYCNNLDNPQMTSFLLKTCSEEFPSQLVNDMASLSLNSTQLDEGYVTRPSTSSNPPDSPSIINKEYYKKDVNNQSPSVFAQPWKKPDIPERWINSKFENDAFTPAYNNNAINVDNLIDISTHQNYDNKVEPTSLEHLGSINETAQDNDDEKLMDRYRYIERASYDGSEVCTEENLSKTATSDFFFKNCFVFHKIDTVEGVTFIFHIEENGWILTHEFVTTFTSYKLCSSIMTALNSMNISVLFREIRRAEYPAEFLQLDKYSLDVSRDEERRITSISLISLQTALILLCKLKIVSREEMDNAFKKNEFLDGSVLRDMWSLILAYRQLRQRIEDYINSRI